MMLMMAWAYVSIFLGMATGSILLEWEHTHPVTAGYIMLAVTVVSIIGGCWLIGRYRDKLLK